MCFRVQWMLIEWILSDEVARGNAVADGEVAERGPSPLEGVCQAPPQASLSRRVEQAPAPTAAASSDTHEGAGSPELQRVVHERQEQRRLKLRAEEVAAAATATADVDHAALRAVQDEIADLHGAAAALSSTGDNSPGYDGGHQKMECGLYSRGSTSAGGRSLD